jgi:F-type H+-transporting ATPase subunit epsilon
MSGSLKIEIVTPEGVIFSEDALLVGLPALDGAIGVRPHHVRLMTQIVPGEITDRTSRGDRYLAVGEGLVEVTADRVTVVTDMAVAVDKIDEASRRRRPPANGPPRASATRSPTKKSRRSTSRWHGPWRSCA